MLIPFDAESFLELDTVCLDALEFGTDCEMRFPIGGVQLAANRKRSCFWLG